MATITDTIRKIVAKAEPYVPQVPKPKKKLSRNKDFRSAFYYWFLPF